MFYHLEEMDFSGDSMRQSLSQIWIHALWSTQDQQPLMLTHFRDAVFLYLKARLDELGCPARIVGGVADHVHVLLSLAAQKPASEIVQQIKRESSCWINQQDYLQARFAWQKGYCALSVSASRVTAVEEYIQNQDAFHKQRSFGEERERFLARYGLYDHRFR